MTYERLHATFVGVVATLVGSIVVAELAGYWLHRLLHSDKFPGLSRGHLIHHFLIYGPRQPMRAEDCTLAKRHRPFNWAGYRTAIERYGLDETELVSLRRCSEGLFHKPDRPIRR